ncbi:aquaporin-like protein [Leishmania tarentolae]|uniref:Aquaporin-like protein n=1 Tax=Leishmania tarentolae TaxID=5689 RepID=A0A640KQL7_LEITA|nr:aquaporin-like protein [Leishmania tarentolae]
MERNALTNSIHGADPAGEADGWSSGVSAPLSFTPPFVSAVHPPCVPLPAASSPPANKGFSAAVEDGSFMIHAPGRAAENVSAGHQGSLIPLVSTSDVSARQPTSQGPFPVGSPQTPPPLAITGWRGGGAADNTDDLGTSSGAMPSSAMNRRADTDLKVDCEDRRAGTGVFDPTEVPALKYTIAVSVTRDGKVVEEQLDPFELGRLYAQRQAALRKLQSRYDFLAVPEWVRLHPLLGTYFAELIGTFGWVLTLALVSVRNESIFNISDATNMTPLPIGFMLTSMIFTFGYISRSHLNPAVSIAVFLVRQMKMTQCCAYILCQLAGGLAAGVVAMVIQGNKEIFVPSVSTSYVSSGIFSELIFTFAMCLVVLNIAYSRQSGNFFYGFAVGMTISAGSASAGRISGGSFNPAAASGLQVAVCLAGRCNDLKSIWIYWLAPVAGAVLAAILFSQMAQPAETQVLEDRKVFQNVNELHRQRITAQAMISRAKTGTGAAKNCTENEEERRFTSSSVSSERTASPFSSSSSDPHGAHEMKEFTPKRTPQMREERDAEYAHVNTQRGADELNRWHNRVLTQAPSGAEVNVSTLAGEVSTLNHA